MSRYIANGVSESRPGTIAAEDYQFPLYIEGTPETGFRPSLAPPKVGYWGITAVTKQTIATDVDPGNVATWLADGVASLAGNEQRFVSLGAANLMERQLGLDTMEPESGWRWLSNTLSPVRNVADIDRRLQFVDDDFNAEAETEAWLSNENNRALAGVAARYGTDMPTELRQARNRDHFVFLQNRALMQAQALQDIETFEDQSYGITEFASMMQSAVQNYLLTDPTFLPSLFIPLGSRGPDGQGLGPVRPARCGPGSPNEAPKPHAARWARSGAFGVPGGSGLGQDRKRRQPGSSGHPRGPERGGGTPGRSGRGTGRVWRCLQHRQPVRPHLTIQGDLRRS